MNRMVAVLNSFISCNCCNGGIHCTKDRESVVNALALIVKLHRVLVLLLLLAKFIALSRLASIA
jgi:hypothetical protein